MNELLRAATKDVSRFLSNQLPKLTTDWWNKLVIDRLSFQQQRTARERGFTHLEQFDFAALLRILDQNWFEISSTLSLPREARSWLKELQTVRNKWAHLSSTDLPPSEAYRDADTLGRLLEAIDGSEETRLAVDAAKNTAMSELVCLGKTGPILKRACEGERIGEMYGTSAIYAGADHREAA